MVWLAASETPRETADVTELRRPWLDEEAAWQRVAESHTCVFTTLRRDGRPVALPLWFVAFDQRLYVRSLAAGKKVSRIRRDPRASVLVEAGERWRELSAVHLSGVARVLDEDDLTVPTVLAAIDEKYAAFSSSGEPVPDATRAHYDRAYVVICFEADDRIVSWDNSLLFAD